MKFYPQQTLANSLHRVRQVAKYISETEQNKQLENTKKFHMCVYVWIGNSDQESSQNQQCETCLSERKQGEGEFHNHY